MSFSAPTPPLLLTKRLTSFLRSNLSPQIHSALLTTLSGKLLAHASPHPVSTLRTQCTVAASIWAIYSAPNASAAIPDALPSRSSSATSTRDSTSSAVTIQLTGAVLVARKLRCGLLFVCIGPAPDGGEQAQTAGGQPLQTPHMTTGEPHSSSPLGSPSEVESVVSAAPTMASTTTTGSVSAGAVVQIRRQTEELAKWLDDKLGPLGVPEEGNGIEVR
ncbi:hypothetical protein BJ170DRAFT_277099 [Xylariales sp. AK1849]|nr:hypothetical protein BJ170DRAFT_277099 [Xylariales sp. AK1849]